MLKVEKNSIYSASLVTNDVDVRSLRDFATDAFGS